MLIARHFGVYKTLEMVSRKYEWPKLHNFVEDWKIPRYSPNKLLHPLQILVGPLKSTTLDFIQSPPSKSYHVIIVVVEQFLKMHIFFCAWRLSTLVKRLYIWWLEKHLIIMAFLLASLVILGYNSSQNFGNTCWRPLKSRINSVITHKVMTN